MKCQLKNFKGHEFTTANKCKKLRLIRIAKKKKCLLTTLCKNYFYATQKSKKKKNQMTRVKRLFYLQKKQNILLPAS